jgi:hypothetical protein
MVHANLLLQKMMVYIAGNAPQMESVQMVFTATALKDVLMVFVKIAIQWIAMII